MTDNLTNLFGGGDPTIDPKEQGDFPVMENGEYAINGIDSFFPLDDEGLPNFKPGFDGSLVAMFNLKLTAGGVGPTMSATRAELILLAKALGGDVTTIPSGETTKFLIQIQKIANAGGKSRKAVVKGGKGWVSYVEGTQPPEGIYTLEFVKARSLDRTTPVTFQMSSGQFPADIIYLDFRIVGDVRGKASLYSGYTFSVQMRNPFTGEIFEASDGGQTPAVKQAKNGGQLIDVRRFFRFCTVFWPTVADWQWTSDIENSPYGVNELSNPVHVMIEEAKRFDRKAVGVIAISPSGYVKLDLAELQVADDDAVVDVDQQEEVALAQPKALLTLVDTIEEMAAGKAFEDTDKDSAEINLTFTEDGVKFAREFIGPLWKELDLPVADDGQRQIGNLSDADATRLEQALREKYPQRTEMGGF